MIPLTVRSQFSLMWGTTAVDRLVRAARQRGYERLALTDTDNLYGLWPFLKACEREGVQPIVGAELSDPLDPLRRPRVVCLVTSDIGYRRLCRLLTRRQLDPRFDLAQAVLEACLRPVDELPLVPAHARPGEPGQPWPPSSAAAAGLPACGSVRQREGSSRSSGCTDPGLLLLTSGVGLLQTLHGAGLPVAAALPRRPTRGAVRLQETARRLAVPLVATPGSFFLDPQDHEVHLVLRAIARNTALSRLAPGDVAAADAWLGPPHEYRRRFSAMPEALDATYPLAERCAGFTGPRHGTVLPPWDGTAAAASPGSAAAALRDAAYLGARRRYGDDLPETVVDRLEHELRQIEAKGFSSYFLVVQDIVRRSPRICGRGSGAASLVAYSLGITNVCPVKHNLYFERFLNPGRTDPPDIDVDFAWDERDDVLFSVLEQHGLHAAMVCNHVLFQPRMAIREVARVHGLTDAEIGRVARRLPWFWQAGAPGGEATDDERELQERLEQMPELEGVEFPAPWPEILRMAQRLLGVPRHLSVHPGGMVVTPRPVADYVPVERAAKGVPIIQWEKDATEDGGLVKIDLLGNRSLGVIRDAIANLRDNGLPFDEGRWEPEDDPQTQALVAAGGTMGCFYVESPAMRLLLQRSGCGDFEHLVVFSSIIRPAANDYIREYLRRLHGGAWQPLHPLLEDVLDETLGIMVYQEDVSKTAMALAGFSHADADGLRKVLSKKDRAHRLRDYRQRFVSGARERGVDDRQLDAIWSMMMSFDGYSFCKPHSASYARVSFQAAYLKRHYPAEFLAAVISNQGGFYSTFAYVSEARRLGLRVLPPDVNRSRVRWRGRGSTLRVGLLAVKGLGHATRERIVAGRAEDAGGPYRNLLDFLQRVRPDETEARALIKCGACDGLAEGQQRAALLWQLARWQRCREGEPGAAKGAPAPPLADLFAAEEEVALPQLPPGSERERLRREFTVLGFLCDRHPMSLFRPQIQRAGVLPISQLPNRVGRRVRFAGWLITGKVVRTSKGQPMEFLTFEDETGLAETVFFPEAYRRLCPRLDWGHPYLLEGRVEEDFGAITVTVHDAEVLAGE